MPPTTRSKTARIAGFPDVSHHGDEYTSHEERPIPLAPREPQTGADPPDVDEIRVRNLSPPRNRRTEKPEIAPSDDLPTYIIDLSLPPSQRYVQVAHDHLAYIEGLPYLFRDLLVGFGLPSRPITLFSRMFLRKLHSREQTEELRGISRVTGVDLSLLVAFNVLLDLFMGCTSGGVQVREGKETKMLHFRTLDWGMNALRKIVVQLAFVERPGSEVIARSITYVGYVGLLTGVRKDLSVSLNFRPYHNSGSNLSDIKFYGQHLLILLGLRPSISARLRDLIIPRTQKPSRSCRPVPLSRPSKAALPDLAMILNDLPAMPTTAAYLIFSDGRTTAVIEKDRVTANTRTSTSFIVATNHDVSLEDGASTRDLRSNHAIISGMKDMVDESADRKDCVVAKWKVACRRFRRSHRNAVDDDVYITKKKLIDWVQDYPVTNEETHFAAIMDPSKGEFVWTSRWEDCAVLRDYVSDVTTP